MGWIRLCIRMSSAEPSTRAAAAASSEDVTAAEDVGTGTAVFVKTVANTAAALRDRNKVWAGERRSSARASVLIQRRNSVFSDVQESPEKIRDGDNMNNSFRIQFEHSELQQEQFICSSCLSAHHDMDQSFCIFCGWKVLAWNLFMFKFGKDSRVNPIPHYICTEYFAMKIKETAQQLSGLISQLTYLVL
jgi:hypothetical protein